MLYTAYKEIIMKTRCLVCAGFSWIQKKSNLNRFFQK